MKQILVPAQKWEVYANKLALMQLCEQKGQTVVSVPAFEHEGYLYMGYAAMHCPTTHERSSTVYAYRLLPEALYDGPQTYTRYHDEDELKAGRRQRGSHQGLIVSFKGKKLVCAEPVEFVRQFPTNNPVTMEEAIAYERSYRQLGWRHFNAQSIEPYWHLHHGFPVSSYFNAERDIDIKVLYWKLGGEIKEILLSGDFALDDVPVLSHCEGRTQQPSQMLLF